MDIEKSKQHFARLITLQNAIAAAFQHHRVFRPDTPPTRRLEARKYLEELLQTHANGIAGSNDAGGCVITAITSIKHAMEKDFVGDLHDGRFGIGTAQKALNLYLKIQWCLGEQPLPPHCPFDCLVLRALGMMPPQFQPWTRWMEIGPYEDAVKRAREEARKAGLTIAEWELWCWGDSERTESV